MLGISAVIGRRPACVEMIGQRRLSRCGAIVTTAQQDRRRLLDQCWASPSTYDCGRLVEGASRP